jgi:heparin binding hemagglutinin HbhA
MSVTTELRKTATDTGYAVVGITDLAVERVREAQTRAAAVRAEIERVRVDAELKKLQGRVQTLPATALSAGVEAAGKAEQAFDELAERGRTLVTRISNQKATKDLLTQGRTTISRGKAAVTTVRRGAGDTRTAAKATVTTAEREASETAAAVRTTTRTKTQGTKSAAKRTTTTARKRAASSKSAGKAAVTTAKKTAQTAAKATEAAAEKVGD